MQKEKIHFFFASNELSNSLNTSMLNGFLSELTEPLYEDCESESSAPPLCTCQIKSCAVFAKMIQISRIQEHT